jgi:hypothetical protein
LPIIRKPTLGDGGGHIKTGAGRNALNYRNIHNVGRRIRTAIEGF